MPRYEFSEGTSSKFWEINLAGKSFTTTYGKIGTDGQTTIKQFNSDADAKKEYEKLIAEKTKKGYVSAGGKKAAAKATPAKGVPTAKATPAKGVPTSKATPAKGVPALNATPAKGVPATGSDRATPRYFEFVEGTSSKYWEIRLDGDSVRTRYGKIGTSGQQTLKDFDGADKATKEYDKLVAEKTKKGYEEKAGPAGGDDHYDEIEE